MIHSNQTSEKTILGWWEDEKGSYVNKCNEDFTVHIDKDLVSEVGAESAFTVHCSLKVFNGKYFSLYILTQ